MTKLTPIIELHIKNREAQEKLAKKNAQEKLEKREKEHIEEILKLLKDHKEELEKNKCNSSNLQIETKQLLDLKDDFNNENKISQNSNKLFTGLEDLNKNLEKMVKSQTEAIE